MSFELVDGQIDAVRAEAARVQDSLTANTKAINSDTSLSDEGKRDRIADETDNVRSRLSALKEREMSLVDEEIQRLGRQLDAKTGSSSTDIIAFRDAQDRAERIQDWEQASDVLARALRTDDHTLAHAVFRRALDSGWRSVINQFTAANPEVASAATELEKWTRFREPDFNRALVYGVMR